MITRNEERNYGRTDNLRGGEGYMLAKVILPMEKMDGKGRLFNHIRLEKNCEIGWHIHEGDAETYYILSGEGEYSDNGELKTVRAGDVTFTDSGEGHSLINRRDEPLDMVALVLYK